MGTLYLVMRRSGMDDLPLFITSDLAKACRFADEAERREQLGEMVGQHEMELLAMSCGKAISFAIYQFEDGRMIAAFTTDQVELA